MIVPDKRGVVGSRHIWEVPGLRQALDSHHWYPASQRCGCGIDLRNSRHWTDHINALASAHEVTAS